MNKKECTIHLDDEVNCRIWGLREEDSKFLWDKFGIFKEGAQYSPAFQLRRWDGKIRFFDLNGKTYVKILDEILPFLINWNYEIHLEDHRINPKQITDRIDEDIFGLPDFKLRPYQVKVVNELLEEGSGLSICATGAGKTSMVAALSLILYLNGLQTLVIVPSSDLVSQTVEELRDKLQIYPLTIGEYSGSVKEIDNPIVVATWQALQNVSHYLSFFKAVIVDESHNIKATVVRDLINVHGKHISNRFGVTGTLPKPKVDQYTIKTALGRVVNEVPASWLIANGYLAEIEILPIELQDEDMELPDYASERAYLKNHEDRTKVIANIIIDLRNRYGNTLVLVNTQALQQGRDLQDLIPDSIYLDGSNKKTERKANYNLFAENDNLLTIASDGIASTGISIDRIFCEVLLDAGKSFVKAIQSVGRGLRKRGDKNKIFVVDIYSKLKYSKKHFKERNKFYKEAGYPVLKTKKVKY